MKALEILKHHISYLTSDGEYVKTVGVRQNYMNEALAELEALQQRSCDGCRHGRFGVDDIGIEVECILIWQCARGNIYADRYEKEQ